MNSELVAEKKAMDFRWLRKRDRNAGPQRNGGACVGKGIHCATASIARVIHLQTDTLNPGDRLLVSKSFYRRHVHGLCGILMGQLLHMLLGLLRCLTFPLGLAFAFGLTFALGLALAFGLTFALG